MLRSVLLGVVWCCLLPVCLSVQASARADFSQSNDFVFKLNSAIDFMLNVARWVFTSHGELALSLPDIQREFGHKTYNGTFRATGGTFRNIGSLHRTGDIAFVKANSSLSLEVALGLSELQAGYTNYSLEVLKILQAGNMSLTVGKNSLKMKMTFTYSPSCRLQVEEIAFDELSGIKLEISGLGAFQLMYDTISSWLISNFEERFRTIANQKMHQKLNGAINEKSDEICKHFPQF